MITKWGAINFKSIPEADMEFYHEPDHSRVIRNLVRGKKFLLY
jgi:hypothetical protein